MFKCKQIVAAALVATASTTALAGGGDLGTLSPSAAFSNTVLGAFTDVWAFSIGADSGLSASLTNVEVSLSSFSAGGIVGFEAWLNGQQVVGSSSTISSNGVTLTTQVLAGGTTLQAGSYKLHVKGTGITGGSASYGGNIVAVSAVPEPESYAMLLAGLGAIGFVVRRRSA